MAIEVIHSPLLVLGSLIVAIMGAFTALRLTSNLRNASIEKRKIRVSQGAFALGTSIWSMHFIAMLAVNFSVPISYDLLRTLASALISVLVVGLAFLSLHFGVRTKKSILIAGILTGFGISGMHYLGMSAISKNIIITYSTFGIVLAIGVGILASIVALELAYGDRSLLSITIGSVVLGIAITAMHHTAMHFSVFSENINAADIPPSPLNNEALALIVMVSSFVLCGLFLLMAFPSANKTPENDGATNPSANSGADIADSLNFVGASETEKHNDADATKSIKIPYEQNNVVKFISAHNIHAIGADGHYTSLYIGADKLFCPWSISRIKDSLNPEEFIPVHRSFLVNKNHVVGLKRDKNKTFCVIGKNSEFEIPVARSQIAKLRTLLQSS
ncbi:MAG: LytTR family transcriptional regulator DNA-binding domain-containing protein [Rhizobiaceae bacterium]|nr:LytTR family transcriptional regulator DNA-binding domain-containing protein [Rhizobiaceae bacterium]